MSRDRNLIHIKHHLRTDSSKADWLIEVLCNYLDIYRILLPHAGMNYVATVHQDINETVVLF